MTGGDPATLGLEVVALPLTYAMKNSSVFNDLRRSGATAAARHVTRFAAT